MKDMFNKLFANYLIKCHKTNYFRNFNKFNKQLINGNCIVRQVNQSSNQRTISLNDNKTNSDSKQIENKLKAKYI